MLAVVLTASTLAGCGQTAKEEKASEPETKTEQAKAEPKTQSGVVTYGVDMTKYEKGSKVRLWLPIPHDNKVQKITDVKYEVSGAEGKLTEDSLGNKMLYVEWSADSNPADRKVTASFHDTRNEILRPELKEEGSIPDDVKEYLNSSSTIPLDGDVQKIATEITNGKTTDLEKARAIYDWIIENFNRDESVKGCGTGDVVTLLKTKLGKCTDINSVFVGLCRAVGIPAREMFGVRMNDADITKNQHCWAQFYLKGTGWVQADPADVLKAVLKKKLDKKSEDTKKIQEYYWGSNDEKRVELSEGRDLTLNPAQAGKPLNNFGYPYAEVNDEPVDYYAPADFVYTISFAQDK